MDASPECFEREARTERGRGTWQFGTLECFISGTSGEMSNFYLNLGYDHSYSSMISCMQVIDRLNLMIKISSRDQYLYFTSEGSYMIVFSTNRHETMSIYKEFTTQHLQPIPNILKT